MYLFIAAGTFGYLLGRGEPWLVALLIGFTWPVGLLAAFLIGMRCRMG
jgi:hypothetical protein